MYSRRFSTEPLEKSSKFGADLISSLFRPSLTSNDHQIDVVRIEPTKSVAYLIQDTEFYEDEDIPIIKKRSSAYDTSDSESEDEEPGIILFNNVTYLRYKLSII